MSLGGRVLRAVLGVAIVTAAALPGRADAAPSFQAVVLPQAQLLASGAGMVVHFKVRCTASTSGLPDIYLARVDQVTGPKTVQRELAPLVPTCDSAWHKVSAAVPIPSPGTDDETSSDNVAPRAWQPTTALVRVENGFSDPEIFAGGVVQVQRGPAPSSSDPALTIAANGRRARRRRRRPVTPDRDLSHRQPGVRLCRLRTGPVEDLRRARLWRDADLLYGVAATARCRRAGGRGPDMAYGCRVRGRSRVRSGLPPELASSARRAPRPARVGRREPDLPLLSPCSDRHKLPVDHDISSLRTAARGCRQASCVHLCDRTNRACLPCDRPRSRVAPTAD